MEALYAIIVACSLSGPAPASCAYVDVPTGPFGSQLECLAAARDHRDGITQQLIDRLGALGAVEGCGTRPQLAQWVEDLGIPR